jgi:hypothetical protein
MGAPFQWMRRVADPATSASATTAKVDRVTFTALVAGIWVLFFLALVMKTSLGFSLKKLITKRTKVAAKNQMAGFEPAPIPEEQLGI